MGGIGSMVGALISVIAILLLAYWSSRLLGKRWGTGVSGHYIKVIDRVQVGNDKYILLIKLKEQILLIGVSDKGVQLLAELEGDFKEPDKGYNAGILPGGFQEILKNYSSRGGKHD